MNTKIYSVFPACGKTYLCEHQEDYDLKILDIDSSEFNWINCYDKFGKRVSRLQNPDFPYNYIEHIKNNIGKADIILISSHASVRDTLDKEGIDFTIVFPDVSCKAEWVGRCFIRDKNGETGCGAELMCNNFYKWIFECWETAEKHECIVLGPTEHLSEYFERWQHDL